MKIPVEILVFDKQNEIFVNEAILFLNESQETFEFSNLFCPQHNDPIHEEETLLTNNVYSFLDKLRFEIKGYHPHIIVVSQRYLASEHLTNLFSSTEEINGHYTGRGILTSYGVKHILEEIPLQVYFMFYFLSLALKFLVKKTLVHTDRRLCIYDQKINKRDLYEILKYGSFCLECNDIVRSLINIDQMRSVRSIIGTISDIAHSKNPNEAYSDLYKKISNNLPNNLAPNASEKKAFETAKKFIQESETKKAFDEVSLIIKEIYPEKYDVAIMLYSRLNQLNLESQKGIINDDAKRIELNRINLSLLELINNLENGI